MPGATNVTPEVAPCKATLIAFSITLAAAGVSGWNKTSGPAPGNADAARPSTVPAPAPDDNGNTSGNHQPQPGTGS
jgi:hypothetical protein